MGLLLKSNQRTIPQPPASLANKDRYTEKSGKQSSAAARHDNTPLLLRLEPKVRAGDDRTMRDNKERALRYKGITRVQRSWKQQKSACMCACMCVYGDGWSLQSTVQSALKARHDQNRATCRLPQPLTQAPVRTATKKVTSSSSLSQC